MKLRRIGPGIANICKLICVIMQIYFIQDVEIAEGDYDGEIIRVDVVSENNRDIIQVMSCSRPCVQSFFFLSITDPLIILCCYAVKFG